MNLIEANDESAVDMLEILAIQARQAKDRQRVKELQLRLETVLSAQEDCDGLVVTLEKDAIMAYFNNRFIVVETKPRVADDVRIRAA